MLGSSQSQSQKAYSDGELRRYRTLNAKHITSVLEQKGCVSDYQVSKDYLPSKLLLGCNHLWLRISREAWLGPCNSRSHEFSVKLSPRANITWRALTWLLAGVSCSWLWASDLCSLANDLFRICWKSSHQYGSRLSPEQGIREKEEEHKTEAIFFSAQPQRWRISTATFCWWHKLQSKWQKATTGFSHQEAEVTRDHPGGCLPQLLTPIKVMLLSRSSTALTRQSSLAYSQTPVYKTLETVKSLFFLVLWLQCSL